MQRRADLGSEGHNSNPCCVPAAQAPVGPASPPRGSDAMAEMMPVSSPARDNHPMVALPQVPAPERAMRWPHAPWLLDFREQLVSRSKSKVLTPQTPWLQSQGIAPGVRRDVLTLSGPSAPAPSHRKPVVKPGIKLLPERPPGSPTPALITRLHFLCFTRYTRFLLFWYFWWDTLQFPVGFGHGK